ncbi:MAG: PQQ-dependent sugar dehydrogenase, partial [Chloroflexota bacterium]|nr:PQQ-dependent sugar dehydrogenase [Chloroflexota bacterium]
MRFILPACLLALALLTVIRWLPPVPRPAHGAGVSSDVQVDLWMDNVTFPVALEFASDGRLFFAERFVGAESPVTGTIRVVDPEGVLQEKPFATITLADSSPTAEKGLLGLALDPDFGENGYVYAYRTAAPDASNPNEHGEILRYTAVLSATDWIGTSMIRVVDDLPVSAGCCHNGGILHFGPDDKLYLSIGDNGASSNGQDLSTRAGKLLRFNPDGTTPPDNPFVDEPAADDAVYAYGLRNVFGYDWHPTTGELYATENGPGCHDELNHIVAGGNYGWPLSYSGDECVDPGFETIPPIWIVDPPVGLTGAAFYTGETMPQLREQLFLGAWNNGALYQVDLSQGKEAPIVSTLIENCAQPIEPGSDHNMLDITTGPDGALYFSCQQDLFPAPPHTGAIYRLTLP